MPLRWLPVALCLTGLALATSSGAELVRAHSHHCPSGGSPSIAFDGTNYLVVWESVVGNRYFQATGVCGARVSTAGNVRDPGGFTITPMESWTDREPSVAFGGESHLVVWMDSRGEPHPDRADVYGSRVSREGAVLDEAGLRLTSLSGERENHPAIAFDGTNYLVVWEYHADSQGTHEIVGVLVTSGGEALRLIHISSGPNQASPVVAFDGTNFLVAWEGGCAGICAARVSPSGLVIDSAGIPVSGWGRAGAPAVAFDGTNYLVVWGGDGGCVGICTTRVSPSGSVLDPGGIAIGRGLLPAVAFAGGNYLVAWLGGDAYDYFYDVRAARVSPSGTVLDPEGFPISPEIPGGVSVNARPAVAFDGSNSFVVWNEWRCGGICGARVNSAGGVLDPNGISISTPTRPPTPGCVVPRVVGLRLARAKARIRSTDCRLGRLRRVRSARPGRVLAQSPRAGARRPSRTRVNLVVGVRRR